MPYLPGHVRRDVERAASARNLVGELVADGLAAVSAAEAALQQIAEGAETLHRLAASGFACPTVDEQTLVLPEDT